MKRAALWLINFISRGQKGEGIFGNKRNIQEPKNCFIVYMRVSRRSWQQHYCLDLNNMLHELLIESKFFMSNLESSFCFFWHFSAWPFFMRRRFRHWTSASRNEVKPPKVWRWKMFKLNNFNQNTFNARALKLKWFAISCKKSFPLKAETRIPSNPISIPWLLHIDQDLCKAKHEKQ